MADRAPPIGYAEWSAWFDDLEAGSFDTELLDRAAAGRMSWTAGVAERLAERMMEAMSSRLDAIGTSLERRLRAAGSETDLLAALIGARREFGRLRRFAALDCLPDVLRGALNELIGRHLEARQTALEKSALADRTGRLTYLVKHNRLDAPARASPKPDDPRQPAATGPRRILLF